MNHEFTPPEIELLFYLARTQIEPEIKAKIHGLFQDEIDWYYLVKIAYQHRLAPLLYWQLNLNFSESVPLDILENLKESFHKNLQRNLFLSGELLKILEIFKSQELMAIPYKSSSMAISVYGNLALRTFDGLKILIRQEDALKCRDLLLSQGYRLDEKYDEEYILVKFDEYRFLKKGEHKIHVQLQWRIPEVHFTFPTDLDSFCHQNNLRKIIVNNHEVTDLALEDLFLVLSVYMAGHYWKSIIWLFDLAELISNHEINWKKVSSIAELKGINRIITINLLLLHHLLKINIPEEFTTEIKTDHVAIDISRKIMEGYFSKMDDQKKGKKGKNRSDLLNETTLHLNIRESKKDGIKDAIFYLFTPKLAEIKSLPALLLPFYSAFRPILLLKNELSDRLNPSPGEYYPTPCKVVEEMLNLAEVGPQDKVYDLGCGDGRIVITAAKNYGAQGIGVDIDPKRIEESKQNAKKQGVENRTEFLLQDIKKMDISDASVLCLYIYSSFLDRYQSKLQRELKPGTRIVSHDFQIDGWKPKRKQYVLHDWVSTLYLWEIY